MNRADAEGVVWALAQWQCPRYERCPMSHDLTIQMHAMGALMAEPTFYRPEDPEAQLHPSVSGVLQWFDTPHLTGVQAEVSSRFADLARVIAHGPQNAETTVALRHLLEAKDAAVRASFNR